MAIKNASFISRKSDGGSDNGEMKSKAFSAIEKAKSDYNKSVDKGRKVLFGYGPTEKEYILKNISPEYKDYYALYEEEQTPNYYAKSDAIRQQTIPGYTAEQVKNLRAPTVNTSPNASTEAKPETETKPETNSGTTPSTSGKQEDGSYSFKDYDELMDFINNMKGQAGEAHDNYMSNSQTASDYVADYAQFLQDIRDVIMGEAQANPLETDWGKSILDYYGVLGENSANAVNAATAGENAGNIDSFAAANAERQRMSRYGQGVQTIMGMSTERFNNMINGLNSIGVNTDILFGGQKGITDTAADYAASLYGTDASSTAAYNELMAALEGNKTYTYDLSDNGVTALLKKAYNDLNPIGSDSSEIDWTATDSDQWKDVIQNVLKAYPNSGLTEGYLRDMIEKIIKGTQAETGTTGVANANTVDVSKLPAWLQSIVLATNK